MDLPYSGTVHIRAGKLYESGMTSVGCHKIFIREQENRVNGFVEMFSSYVNDGSFKRVRFSLLAH